MTPARAPIRDVAVIIPTYNERENLELIISRVRAAVPGAAVLVVDDGSPDGTGELADDLARGDERIRVLHRAAKSGLGSAYLAGFAWALQRDFGVLVEMDADGSHDPAELPALLAALADADLVLGSRWVPGGTVANWPRSRQILSRGGNAYARLMLGIEARDLTGGYRAYRADTLRAIDLETVESQGYCFQVDLARRAFRAGLTVAEVPITFTERTRGASKMSRAIIVEALWRVTRWGLAARVRGGDGEDPRSGGDGPLSSVAGALAPAGQQLAAESPDHQPGPGQPAGAVIDDEVAERVHAGLAGD
jgi:dolichol-phosphate mannosyltransferase